MWCARRIRIDRCDGAMQERCEILGCEEQLPGIVFSVLAMASLFGMGANSIEPRPA
jgi:hypothetical protein